MARRPIDLLAICLRVDNTDLLAKNYVPKLAILIDSAAMGTILWNAHGAWVKYGDLRMVMTLLVIFSVSVAVHKRVHTWRLRPFIDAVVNTRAKDVTVGKEDGELLASLWILIKQDVVISHAREVQNHLDFPCMADYNILFDKDPKTGKQFTIFFTHGHVFGPGIHNSVDKWPQTPSMDAFVYGHTHRKVNMQSADHPEVTVFNPGSVGIPKDGTHSCGIYEDGEFRHVILGE